MNLRRTVAPFAVLLVLSPAARAADTPRPTARPAAAYTNEDLQKRHPTPTPAEVAADGIATATARATASPTATPVEYEGHAGVALERMKEYRTRLEDAKAEVDAARKNVAEAESRLAEASSLARPSNFYGTKNPEVPALEAELEKAKARLATSEQELENIEAAAAKEGVR
jgi:hypothetical protein